MNEQDFQKTRMEFVAQWGTLGSSWGINRTMAQIHALLMIAVEPMHTNQVMEELKISRGNANANLRDLVGWGLVRRITYPGDRKEYFEAEKDVWSIFCIVARERKRREIDPVQSVLQSASSQSFNSNDPAQKLFGQQLSALSDFVQTTDQILVKVARSDKSKVIPFLLKRFK